MARREVVRLGLFPELGYFQPPSLVENALDNDRTSISGSGSISARRKATKGTPSVSSRTVSPSVFSSSDLKDNVVAVLKRRFRTDRPTNLGDDSATRWTDRVSEIEMDAERIWASRKRRLDDEIDRDNQTGAPKAKSARTETISGLNGNGETLETGSIAVAQSAKNGSKDSSEQVNGTTSRSRFGLLEPDEVELGDEEMMDDSPAVVATKHRTVLRPIYGRQRLKDRIVCFQEVPQTLPAADQDDEEEREDALAAFRAGQEYEQRKLSKWMTPASTKRVSERRPDVPAIQAANTTSGISSVVPAIVLIAPSISNASSTTLFQFGPPSTASTTVSEPASLASAPTICLAPVTTVTWSTSLTSPIVAVQPYSSTNTNSMASVSTGTGSTFLLPTSTVPPTSMASSLSVSPAMSPADVSVNVTIPLPPPKSAEGPSTSATLRLPVSSASSGSDQSGFSFNFAKPPTTSNPSNPSATSGYNFTSGNGNLSTAPGFNFAAGNPTTTTSGFSFSSGNTSSSAGFNFTASNPPATSSGFNFSAPNPPVTSGGFAFSFTGQPVSSGNFNFASLDPAATNVFSTVGSAQNIVRKKPTSTSSFLARRRNR